MSDLVLELTEFWIAVFFLVGACLGSFANVVIYRLPQGQSLIRPGSSCRSCGAPVRWFDNIPIASWFLRRGRCRSCGAKFSWRYPLVEFLGGVLFALAFAQLGWSWSLLEALPFVWALLACTFIDFDHMILPDEFTLSGIVLGLVGAALNPERSFLDAGLGVLLGGGFLWFMAWIYYSLTGNDGMGGGDIKLLAWIGAVLGVQAVPFVIVVSAVTGTVIGLLVARRDERGLKAAIPYGPYLALGAIIFLFGGRTVALDYWQAFLPS